MELPKTLVAASERATGGAYFVMATAHIMAELIEIQRQLLAVQLTDAWRGPSAKLALKQWEEILRGVQDLSQCAAEAKQQAQMIAALVRSAL